MFSRSCQYALQGILYVAFHQKEGMPIGLDEIAKTQRIPKHYLSKILQVLVKHNLLLSYKGPKGGFTLAKDTSKIKLMNVVKAIDGTHLLDNCAIGFKVCSDKTPCPVHEEYKKIKEKIKTILMQKTLKDLIEDIEDGKSFVTYYKQ